jgi:diadenosine tetraphosphate (Ap4A) HIT family hydrolase
MAGNCEFALHPRLAEDTVFVADWVLSRVLLMNDRRYWWLILVPRRPALMELHEVGPTDRLALMEEVARAGAVLKTVAGAAKINTGALGNLVPQLHVHVVARAPGDPAWPGPVWGQSPAEPYAADALSQRLTALRARL